jgi:hypothetical protein
MQLGDFPFLVAVSVAICFLAAMVCLDSSRRGHCLHRVGP